MLEGTDAEKALLAQLLNDIRNAGPEGAEFISRLENASTPTYFHIGTEAILADGTVVQLSDTGGGLTVWPSGSATGDNEVYIDPTNLITYMGTDGNPHQETPAGLLLHEAGHADLLNANDPRQLGGGSGAEAAVRELTNPIRSELGLTPEADPP